MYEKFKEIDGTHPWRSVSPDGYVDYQARYRPHGRVLFFNFPLAKEMGLIPPIILEHHKELEQVILDTSHFRSLTSSTSERGKKYSARNDQSLPYMATRYPSDFNIASRQGQDSRATAAVSWNG
jgi:hypothetical protein